MIKERIDEVTKAKRQIAEGSLTIWNARLEALVAAGDLKGALDQLKTPLEEAEINNCGCNVQCPAGLRSDLAAGIQPVGVGSAKSG